VLLGQRGRAIVDAIPCLERAVALDSEMVDGWALLGDAYRLVWIYGMAPASATIPLSRRALDRALALDPGRVDALVFRAAAWRNESRLPRAQEDIDRAIALDPDNPEALLERGIERKLAGDTAGAREDWVRAKTLAPDTATADLAEQNLALLDAGPVSR
jgi:tetratricopeptide (TPR) repeat protein